MLVRNKGGVFDVRDASLLLEFLGVKNEAGAYTVAAGVELVAAVPFVLGNSEQLAVGSGQLAVSNEQRGVAWTLSTFDLDRFGERVDPAGWDFKQYLNNPVVEWAHRYDIPAIGKIEGLCADEKGLHGRVVFNCKDYDPFGWAVGERVRAGVIRAGSVGFRVIEIEIPDKETAKDGTSLIFRKQELLEFSICNVPANPFALTKSIEAAKADVTQGFSLPHFWGGLINNF